MEVHNYVVATMATPAEHGFGPLYLTGKESGEESRTWIKSLHRCRNRWSFKRTSWTWSLSAENALPLRASAFAGKQLLLW
jgi:hypothetical protein